MNAPTIFSADPHPWTKSYPPGVRWDADLSIAPLQSILEDSARRWPDRPAIEFMGKRISYRELDALAGRAAKGFQSLGVKPGVHVGLFLRTRPHYIIAFFGVMKARDGRQLLAARCRGSAWSQGGGQRDGRDGHGRSRGALSADGATSRTRLKTLVVGNIAEMSPVPEMVRAGFEKAGQLAPVAVDAHHMTWARLLDNDGAYQEYLSAICTRRSRSCNITGGTTGSPKGAMLTHANLASACAQYVETTHTQPATMDEGTERVLAVLPPFHIYALSVNMMLGIKLGAELVLHTRFDVAAIVKESSRRRSRPSPACRRCMSRSSIIPASENMDLSSLNIALRVARRFHSKCRSVSSSFQAAVWPKAGA